MSWRREITKIKDLMKVGCRLTSLLSRSCQHCKHYKLCSMSFLNKHKRFLVALFLAEGLIIVWAWPWMWQKTALQDEFVPHRMFFQLNVEDHLCRSVSRTISPPLAASPTCEIWTQGTATHNAPAICSFISLEHPALVQALKFINIHTTFIYGNVGVLVSETG